MTPERAAEVLRGEKATAYDRVTAELLGADALEFQAWYADAGYRAQLERLRAEWEKERKG